MQKVSVLVVHGSYSEIYAKEFHRLVQRVRARLEHLVIGAYLECTDISLTEVIANVVIKHQSDQPLSVQILPLFLSPGVHVQEDIPEAIAPLTEQFPEVSIKVHEYLGAKGRLADCLDNQFKRHPEAKRILVAHGSRRAGANPVIESLGQSLNAKVAYWATEPSLQESIAVITKEDSAASKICVVPYFLFPGKIPEVIVSQIKELKLDYARFEFYLGEPFGTQADCATVIAQILALPK